MAQIETKMMAMSIIQILKNPNISEKEKNDMILAVMEEAIKK